MALKTREALLADMDADLANNTSKKISPRHIRERMKDLARSALGGRVPCITDYIDGGDDIDEAWAQAFANSDVVRLPAGVWRASSLELRAGKTLLTDGYSTVIHQKTGVATGTRLIRITGSRARLAPGGDISLRGNIATDTDEQNPAIFIRGSSDISDIVIGNVAGADIRGDVIYVGGLKTAGVSNVAIGRVTGANVLRNVISVTGGQHVSIDQVGGSAVGYMTFDIEPNANSQLCKFIRVGSIRGGHVGVVGHSAADFVELVEIGFLDLAHGYATNTTPEYSPYFGYIEETGLWLSNCRGVSVGFYRARDFEDHAIKCGGAMPASFRIGYVDWENCNFGEVTFNSMMEVTVAGRVVIDGGRVSLQEAEGKVFYTESDMNTVSVSGVELV